MAAGKTTAAAWDAWIVFLDESGQGLSLPTGRTWARRGHTPVVHVRGGGTGRVNLAGLACYRPGHRPRLIGSTGAARTSPSPCSGPTTGTCWWPPTSN